MLNMKNVKANLNK